MATRLTPLRALVATAAVVLATAAPAAADPSSAPACAPDRPCASDPNCPEVAIALPAGPHAQSGGPSTSQCVNRTVAPKATVTEIAGSYRLP
ncbi:hypothetical protein [Tsukamurella hominis]|uniref:hypothetical protein n=1 Tax=Tsukamurella hominis TaxID=1970232 RepID=UPI0039ED7E1E